MCKSGRSVLQKPSHEPTTLLPVNTNQPAPPPPAPPDCRRRARHLFKPRGEVGPADTHPKRAGGTPGGRGGVPGDPEKKKVRNRFRRNPKTSGGHPPPGVPPPTPRRGGVPPVVFGFSLTTLAVPPPPLGGGLQKKPEAGTIEAET